MWNTAFGYGLYVVLYRLLRASGMGESAGGVVAVVVANVIAVPQAFFAYKHLVFRTHGNHLVELGRFILSNSLLQFVVNPCLFLLVVRLPLGPLVALARRVLAVVHLERIADPAVVGQALLLPVLAIASYLLHHHFSFRPKSADKMPA